MQNKKSLLMLTWLALALPVGAAPTELIVGQVAPLKDPSSVGNQLRLGMQIYIDAVNERGGVNGARLKLVSKDRGFDAADSVARTRELLTEANPVALVGLLGTGPTEALVREKVLSAVGVPVVGVRTGAASLHEPMQPLIFHTRTSYSVEVNKIAAHMATIGYKKIAVFYEKSAFGLEGYAQAQKSIKARGLTLVGDASYEQNSTDVKAAVANLVKAAPAAIIVVANSNATADFYKQLRDEKSTAFVVALSAVDGAAVVKRIGKQAAQGLGVAQVAPDPANKSVALMRQLQDDAKKYAPAEAELTSAVSEGYVAARVLVEGLTRAGPKPTPAKLSRALETIKDLDLGGFRVNYSNRNHSGSSAVDIGVLSPAGKMVR